MGVKKEKIHNEGKVRRPVGVMEGHKLKLFDVCEQITKTEAILLKCPHK